MPCCQLVVRKIQLSGAFAVTNLPGNLCKAKTKDFLYADIMSPATKMTGQ